MLGMIEINLLPQEYRVQERTPLGFILTVVIGICVVGSVVIYGFKLQNDLNEQQERNARLTEEKKKADDIAAKYDATKADITKAEKRQNTIIEISQTKIVWSLKLVQFGAILADSPAFWIDRLTLDRGRGNGTFSFSAYALGSDLRKVAIFREKFKNDTNFWYHYEDMVCNTETNMRNGGPLAVFGSYTGNVVKFSVQMPVK